MRGICELEDRRSASERRIAALRAKRTRHGTRARYRAGCGCPECREANATYQRQRKERELARSAASRRVPAEPFRTVLLAAAAHVGVEPAELAVAAGLTRTTANGLVTRRYSEISNETAERIRKLARLLPDARPNTRGAA